ncbi:MAG: redoxin domain-containing protein, partial [Planctomycetota bacterium]
PKVWVRGRVVTDEGKPVPKTDLSGEIENLLGDGSPVPEGWVRWAPTEWAQTNEQGEYQIRLAPGKCRINYSGEGLPSVDQLSVMVDGTTEQRVPDIVVRALPKIRGMVVGLDGRPVHRAIVRPHSNTSLRYKVKPQLTDEKGEFEFSLPHLPANLETGERVYEHQVFAYLPHESVGGVTTVDLRDAKAAGTLTIRMLKQPAKWPLSAMRNAFNPWEQGDASSRPDRKLTAKNAAGIVAPELDGNLWLNTEKRSLADFRGKYVFLDFYTTWCGPCAGDFSSVKMVHDLFHDQGVTVIGVHDNSSAHDVIRDHAIANGMDIPIVVDHPDGRILKSYQEPGLVPGYPGYLLLDRDGRLITADFTTPGPLLRVYKVELVRQLLLQDTTR